MRELHFKDGSPCFEYGVQIGLGKMPGQAAQDYLDTALRVSGMRASGQVDHRTQQPYGYERLTKDEREILMGIMWARGGFKHVVGHTPGQFNVGLLCDNGPDDERTHDTYVMMRCARTSGMIANSAWVNDNSDVGIIHRNDT